MDNFVIPENFYFHGTSETDRFVYIQTPLLLIKDAVFSDITDGAKIMYSLLLNRVGLSISNNMMDEQGRTYILYSQEELSADLGKSTKQIGRYYKELESFNLIERKRVLNQKWRIYVLNFQAVYEYLKSLESEKSEENQGVVAMSSPSGQKCLVRLDKNVQSDQTKMSSPTRQKCPVYINNNNIENYNIENHSFFQQKSSERMNEPIQKKLEYEDLTDGVLYPVDQLDDFFPYENLREILTYSHFVVECNLFTLDNDQRKERALSELKWLVDYKSIEHNVDIIDTLLDYASDIVALGESLTINKVRYSSDMLGKRFYQLDMFTLSHAANYICEFQKQYRISKPKHFYISTLLQAKSNMDASISSQVAYDMAHWNE